MVPVTHRRRVKALVALNACTIPCNFVFGKSPERDRAQRSSQKAFAATAGAASAAGAAAGAAASNVTPFLAGRAARAGIASAGALAFSVLRRDRDWRRSLASSSSARKTGGDANEGLEGDGLDLRFQKTRLVTFAGMVLGYAVYYFTRLSFTYVGLAMRKDLGLSMVQLGTISSLFPLAYMNSKFLSGVLSDLLGSPVLIFSLGLMLTGVLNMAFAAVSTVPLFTAIWVLNGLFQGCGATPCNKMLVNWFPARSRGKWWSSWNASHNIGGFLIPLLAGGLAARFGWRYGMLGPGAIAVFAGLLALLTMKDSPEKAGLPSAEEKEKGRLQRLVKEFAKEVVSGIPVSLVNPETARQSPHFFQMDRYLTVFSLKPKDGSTADSAVQDFSVKDLTRIYKGPELLMNAPSLGVLAQHCVALDTTRADRRVIFVFDEPLERDKFYTCLKILRMSVDISQPS